VPEMEAIGRIEVLARCWYVLDPGLGGGNSVSDHDHPTVTGRNIPLDNPDLPELLRFFHGHLGPYAVLGYRIGQRAMSVLGAGKYFGMRVTVIGPKTTPYTCLIDGLQVSTGCTMGKGNIVAQSTDPRPGALFDLRFDFRDQRLSVTVPDTVGKTVAGWLQAGLAEDELFAKTRDHPAEELWQETLGERSHS
jgi:hypothetical protein